MNDEICVICNFLSCYMRPEGPWHRRWALLSTFVPCARTGLTGHNGSPTPPTERKRRRHDQKRKNKGKIHSKAGLGTPPLHRCTPPYPPGALSLLPRNSPLWYARTPERRPWPSPPTDTAATGTAASFTLKPPRPPYVASSSAAAMPGTS